MLLGHWDAIDTARDYVCAVCWGSLVIDHIDARHDNVHCAQGDECTGQGFVTRKYAERRLKESASEYVEARWNLKEALRLKSSLTSKDEQAIYKELGF